MAFEIDRDGGSAIRTGVLLQVQADASYRYIVERSLTSGSGFVEIAELPDISGQPQTFEDRLPLDNITRYYRGRARRDGELDSAATAEVSAVPRQL